MKRFCFVLLIMLTCVSLVFASAASEKVSNENVVVTAARPIPDDISFPDGDSLDNNIWTRLYESELGIKIEYDWLVPVAQYDQKLSLSITADTLPDMFSVNASQLKLLVEEGMIADLSKVYDEYASDLTKNVLSQDGGSAMESATFNGKLYALPKMESAFGNANVLWIRTDWLEKLGLEEPKTMEDLLNVIEAFASNDPDGNGKKDTFGLAVNMDLYGTMFASLTGFFNGYGSYPNSWVEQEDGTLLNGNILPETKDALKALQKLYKDGCIDPEFGVKNCFAISPDVGSGKIGVMYGLFWNMGWITEMKAADPSVEWKAFSILAVDGKDAIAQVPFPINKYFVVNSDAKNPEALIKMLNLVLEKNFGATAEPDKYNVDSEGRPIFEYPFMYCEPPMKNLDAQTHVTEALATGDSSKLNAEETGYYDQIVAYRNGDINGWGSEMNYGPESSMAVINEYVKDGRFISDKYYGSVTEGMSKSQAVLDQLTVQVFTDIILGKDISAFDQYVKDWNALGGDVITGEVNEWKKNR